MQRDKAELNRLEPDEKDQSHRRVDSSGSRRLIACCPEWDVTTEGEAVEEAISMLKASAAGYIEVVGIDNIPHFPVGSSGKTLSWGLSGTLPVLAH